MNLASVIVLLIVVALAALAVWRNVRKGSPCECGGSCASLRSCLNRRNGCRACDGNCGHCGGRGVDSDGGVGV